MKKQDVEYGAFNMDEILGHSKNEIVDYFGKPYLSFNNLCVFSLPGGTVAICFLLGKASSYIIYDRNGKVIYSNMNTISSAEQVQDFKGKPFAEFVAEYGTPHVDIGSGIPILVYFSNHGSFYKIWLVNKTIEQIVELSIYPEV